MKKNLLAAFAASTLSATTLAQQPDYDHLGIKKIETDYASGSYQILGSYEFSNTIYVTGIFQRTNNPGYFPDTDEKSFGIGYKSSFNDNSSWYANVNYIDSEYISYTHRKNSDEGFAINAGIRTFISDKFEVGLNYEIIDITPSQTSNISGYVQYHINDHFGVLLELSDEAGYGHGFEIRYNF